MEFISERVSTERKPDGVSVVITARLSRGQEALLVAWCLAWTCCGIYFIYALTQPQPPATRQGLLVMLAFWTYFEIRIGRVLLWRKKGYELLRLRGGTFIIKDSLFRFGKANDYFLDNIQKFGPITIDETSWKWQLVDSFWTRGGERLGFEYLGKKVAFGKGLTRLEAQRIAELLARELKRARKVVQN
ncbi:MAG TPA: hypothetical protein VHL57_11415 [Flavobacteriales bacterium]|jgi:hypothetical protein|nr:hypothetical protein [Flavobacteriales bacterium]